MNQIIINTLLSVKDMGYRIDAVEYAVRKISKVTRVQNTQNFLMIGTILGSMYILKDHEKKIKGLNSRLNKLDYEVAACKMRKDHYNDYDDDFKEI